MIKLQISKRKSKRRSNKKSKRILKKNSKNLIEIITKKKVKIFNENDLQKIYTYLKKLRNGGVVLDYHGVLDTVEPDYKLFLNNKINVVCCSYVGRYSKNRINARKDLLKRIKEKQINWAVLVFKRSRGKNKNFYHEIGSKAWFCKTINCEVFIDDSKDHVKSVESIDNNINSLLITKKKNLKYYLKNL